MTLRARLADAVYWAGWNVLWLLPERWARAAFDVVAKVTWFHHGRGVVQLELNLGRVMNADPESPEVRAMSRRALRSYLRYYCETFLLPRWSPAQVMDRVVAVGPEKLDAALAKGGAIITLPHSGNWDWAGAWAARRYGALGTVAERLRPEGVFQKFLKARSALGISLMPLTGEGGTYEYLRDHVTNGRLVALLGDRDVARTGMTNEFFSHKAPLPIGAALLAIDTGRPLFTCATHYDGDTLVIVFDDVVEVDATPVRGRDRLRRAQEVTAVVAGRFEAHIRRHPESWYQMQPVWPDLVAPANVKSGG